MGGRRGGGCSSHKIRCDSVTGEAWRRLLGFTRLCFPLLTGLKFSITEGKAEM